uniref:ATP synthase F0 subunit 6 n=3 Tax=unclassified Acanthobothrium TaxID=2666008 RepID=A0A8K1SZ58_9CEST|nr:ATP synthase F0 subunit 6 [Acanthobothrium sp. MZUSP 8033]UFQ89022.1 ATP synthase F0 subunit 6 [Acanthobothrium sp. MZUSP 8034]UFQ89034.1 ATP synthase F0 subunit 6 [Acanthobothrium sp. MZUSP 8035]
MFYIFNNISSMLSMLYVNLVGMFSYYYLSFLSLVLFLFISYRFPYCYSPYLFSVFLIIVVFSGFMSLFLLRLFGDVNEFFSGFVPVGTPLYICPLVCLAETISYIIRPFVLVFRPFINISLGCFGAVAIGNFCFVNSLWLVVLCFIFFYEVFVALVHWFIVANILAFSVDH